MKKIKFIAVLAMAMISVSTFSAIPASADWQCEGGFVTYTDSEGNLATGWNTIEDKKYYFNKDGIMKAGWANTSDGTTYFFDDMGVMRTGWLIKRDGVRYYFDENGKMITGWSTIDGEKYYFNKDGTAKSGWVTTSQSKYYFRLDGRMVKDCCFQIDDEYYKFDKNGKFDDTKITNDYSVFSDEYDVFSDDLDISAALDEYDIVNGDLKEFNIPTDDMSISTILTSSNIKSVLESETYIQGFTLYKNVPAVAIIEYDDEDDIVIYMLIFEWSSSSLTSLTEDYDDKFGNAVESTDENIMWKDDSSDNVVIVVYNEDFILVAGGYNK